MNKPDRAARVVANAKLNDSADAALRQQGRELEQAVSLLGQQVDMLKQERTRLNAELTECYARMRREP